MGASDLPLASGREIVRCLTERFGLTLIERSKNHYILKREGKSVPSPGGRRYPMQISIPDHREVKRELLATELRHIGVDHKEFAKQFKAM